MVEQPSSAASADRLIWLDLEMTGLNPSTDWIIEAAVVITDAQLDVVAESPVWVLHQPQAVMDTMDDWNRRTHGDSGLTARVVASSLGQSQAEEEILAFVRHWCVPDSSPMCGNSIGQDRRFLARHMPRLEAFFQYRNIDVSTLKELARRWAPALPKYPKKTAHRALDDIHESIGELRYYRRTLLRSEADLGALNFSD